MGEKVLYYGVLPTKGPLNIYFETCDRYNVQAVAKHTAHVFFFFDFFGADDVGVTGRDSFLSAFCTSSIPRFYRHHQLSITLVKKKPSPSPSNPSL